MDVGNENFDFVKLVNLKGNVENITPHKIAVIAFIREYGLLKMEAKKMVDCAVSPKYRKDFCMLAMKLIQCPDMEFKELESLLTDGRYNLLSVHLQNFCVRLQNIYVNGISALTDCVTSTVDKLMIEQSEVNPCIITRYSVLGLYLRRILLCLDKLTFVQVVSLYKSFCLYYQRGRPGLMMRSLSKEKLNNMEPQMGTSTSPTAVDDLKPLELSMRMNFVDRDNTFEECQWSRKQAELFSSQQANLLEINEKKALPAKQLQKTISQIVKDIPEYPDIHFLSFMNCVRMKEFCGAQDSLYNCFDRAVFSGAGGAGGAGSATEKNRSYRYAALNRAALHTKFGHNELAMEAVREAVSRGQEAGDAGCVAAAAGWGARAGGRARRAALLARAPRAPRAAAAAAPPTATHRALNATPPKDVFQILAKGESLNYLHSMTDLTVSGLGTAAALWALYGKTEMASITAQLLLNLNTKCSVGSVWVWHWAEAAGAGAAAAWRGLGALAAAVPAHLPSPHAARLAHTQHAQHALTTGKWEEAEHSINRLASLDRWESQLLRAELYFQRSNPTEALDVLFDVLDSCRHEDHSVHYMSIRVRAMILVSQVQHCYSNIQSTNIMVLNEALSLARKFHLHYLAALVELHIANVKLSLGCATNALYLVRKALPTVMAHGGAYDTARALLLYTKCRVATAAAGGEARAQVLASCCDSLETAKRNFAKVGANARLMHTWYLQAQLYNDIGNQASRNQCAWMYRQLESQSSIEPSNKLLIMF